MPGKAEFHLHAVSGLIVATAANSVLFAWRNPLVTQAQQTNPRGMRLKRAIATWLTTTSSTQSEVGLSMTEFVDLTGDYTGGTDVSHPTTDANRAYRVLGPDINPIPSNAGTTTVINPGNPSVMVSGSARIALTAGLTPASPTINTHPFAQETDIDLAVATAVPLLKVVTRFEPSFEGSEHCKGKIFLPGTGLVVRNPIAIPASMVGRVKVELIWEES